MHGKNAGIHGRAHLQGQRRVKRPTRSRRTTSSFREESPLKQKLRGYERERKAAYKQQQQIQGSLAPLAREGEEGALRTRYVATLGGLEDRLAALEAWLASLPSPP